MKRTKRAAIFVVGALTSLVTLVAAQAAYTPIARPVHTGGFDPFGVGIHPGTNTVFTANSGSNNLAVVNGATKELITNVATDVGPRGVAVDDVRNRVYVSHYGRYTSSGTTVKVIDATTFGVLNTITTGGTGGFGIAVNKTTNKIYVANFGSDNVSIIDGATGSASTVAVGSQPIGVAVNEATNKVFVTNYAGNSISIIDGATGLVTKTLVDNPTQDADLPGKPYVKRISGPWGIAANSNTNKVYVAISAIGGANGPRLSVIDGTTEEIMTYIKVSSPRGVAVDLANDRVWLASYGGSGGTVTGYNGTTLSSSGIGNSTVGFATFEVAVNSATGEVWAGSPGNQNPWFRRSTEDPYNAVLMDPMGFFTNGQRGWQSGDPGFLAYLQSY